MDAQIKKGLIEALVLAIVAKGDTYGYKLMLDTAQILSLSESTLYPVLRRLEEQGCVDTYTQEFNSRLRKYYRITDAGFAKLRNYKEQWAQARKIINFIMDTEEPT